MIFGLTDDDTIAQTLPRVDFILFKGQKKQEKTTKEGKKYQVFGRDLQDKFRLETKDTYLSKLILKKNQTIYIEQLTILLASEEIERSFSTAMTLYDASGLLQKCDRQTIYAKTDYYTDPFGHKRRQLKSCNQPCPVKDTNSECPYKCKQEGVLLFYIPELLDAGLNKLGKLTLHSFTDIIGISQQLQKIKSQFGSISRSPFPSPNTFNKIPLLLYRNEVKIKRPIIKDGLRTGKKAEGTTWAVQLAIHPNFVKQWQSYQIAKELHQCGHVPPPALLSQVYGVPAGEIIDVIPATTEKTFFITPDTKS